MRLPAADCRIHVTRIKFESETAPTGALGRDYRGAAAQETVQHDVAPRRGIHDGIGDHRDRLHGRMKREQIALIA
jgi:hypothetical protein